MIANQQKHNVLIQKPIHNPWHHEQYYVEMQNSNKGNVKANLKKFVCYMGYNLMTCNKKQLIKIIEEFNVVTGWVPLKQGQVNEEMQINKLED